MGYVQPGDLIREIERRQKDPVYSLLPINITIEFLNPSGKKLFAKTKLDGRELGLAVVAECCEEVSSFTKVPVEPEAISADLQHLLSLG